jgi:hypothetical protein
MDFWIDRLFKQSLGVFVNAYGVHPPSGSSRIAPFNGG